ncbi:hypothetical protein KY290_033657 [Solanum tuberosum]|uniref:Uncharacterized protein n=1 Tax=Solanum tuberosum TaxID=4113 RepID=A0ABQ7U2T6_SOLTU|nr:hypothetical protein KY289_033028 [Solanum tuberosum]KAH0647671.1 hypothetical protein KY285_032919 [Solanum tuberosum]KAH0740614.1 hypothetical protein KY290_033657 [Solanum tuberosum]
MASVSIGITNLVGICVWKLGFYIVNSINGGIDVYGAMACVCWIVIFSAEDVRRPDNGSKTLSELKFQPARQWHVSAILPSFPSCPE